MSINNNYLLFRLDLDAWINEPLQESESDSDSDVGPSIFIKLDKSDYGSRNEKYQPELTEEERDRIREARKQEQLNNPHYLKGPLKKTEKNGSLETADNVPISDIDLSIPLKVIPQKRSDKYLNTSSAKEKKKSKKKSNKKSKKHKKDRYFFYMWRYRGI